MWTCRTEQHRMLNNFKQYEKIFRNSHGALGHASHYNESGPDRWNSRGQKKVTVTTVLIHAKEIQNETHPWWRWPSVSRLPVKSAPTHLTPLTKRGGGGVYEGLSVCPQELPVLPRDWWSISGVIISLSSFSSPFSSLSASPPLSIPKLLSVPFSLPTPSPLHVPSLSFASVRL